ncbi:unnamed protein product [Urochloa decumbens]|uniref:DUF1618 domain-containing protein n=1 Tax=Urochloa decumbens TaxID=240449 RepID=A0ABC9BA25_9POAL
METEPSDDSPATAAGPSPPRWVTLNRYSYRMRSAPAVAGAAATSAASHTSTSHRFNVSFVLAAPPACSTFYGDWASSDDYVPHRDHEIVAAHGDCLLLDVTCPGRGPAVCDYFLYEAGAARPPSLSLLPGCFFPMAFERGKDNVTGRGEEARYLWNDNTGVLRSGSAGEVITVVQLEVPDSVKRKIRDKAELCVIDTGKLEWELNREVPIVHGEATAGKAKELMLWWETDVAVPVSDRFLCFVDYFRGFLVCDMAVDMAAVELRYVPLPVEVSDLNPNFHGRPCTASFQNLAAASTGAVRFVTVKYRCCRSRGGASDSRCQCGRFLFTVATWTLSLITAVDNPAAAGWVKDGVLDCEQLWAMPGYGSIPRRPLTYPVVSCDDDDPDMVCFMVRNGWQYSRNPEDRKVWMLEIDIRSKTLRSVVNVEEQTSDELVAAKLQC